MTTNKTKWIKEFDKEFGSSDFWLNNTNYPRNYHTIKAFILSTLEEYSEEVEKIVVSTGDEVLSPTNSSDMAIEQMTIKQFKKLSKLNTTYGLKIKENIK